MRKHLAYIFVVVALIFASAGADAQRRYGKGLPGTGSTKPAHTIFTCPGEDCSTTMNISWASPVGTDCMVEVINMKDNSTALYSYNDPYYCTTFDSVYSKLHNLQDVYERHIFDKHGVELINLKPDTDYAYRIVTHNPETNRKEYSDVHRFHTAGADSWKAAIISDFHHWSPMWERLDAAMYMLDVLDTVSGGYDFVLTPGDQCAWGGGFNFWTELAEQPAYKNYMWAGVQGNHDHETRNHTRRDAFFRDSHYNPQNGYAGQEGVSYWFKYGDVLFFMLNNEAMRSSESLPPVFSWMEKVVKKHPSKYIVVVQHYEWLIGTNGADSQLDRFRSFFDRIGVDLAIAGNNHAYLRTYPLLYREPVPAGYGTYYVVAPSSDNNRGRSLKEMVANEEIVEKRWSEGGRTVGGMIMDVNPERIVMTLYDRYGHVQDTFTQPAKR